MYTSNDKFYQQLLATAMIEKVGTQPIVIGITGNVAAGKTTFAQQLQRFCQQRLPKAQTVLVSTDDFLLPNATLKAHHLMAVKGFPQSYRSALMRQFVMRVQTKRRITLPSYNHAINDIDQQWSQTISQPDIIIVEGLMVLQPVFQSLLTTSVFLTVAPEVNYRWYLARCMALNLPARYQLDQRAFTRLAHHNWRTINWRNYQENVLPLKNRAQFQIQLNAAHQIATIIVPTDDNDLMSIGEA
ncbi:hypothetical protein C5Z25_10290 [Lactobacillus sp. CBA3605]|uniref:type I pantothenate kinase n=1 Tax=Lactobacillus sp. CBA3605 TaxID=2099788 RepID=UPI000CFBFB4B|nr:hypothetical protein [Lactobacillus sp. CBA3605]AVK62136.1 hypothetical protein C5Z25_10290 [Lactobacillus sp. CBA3605]